MQFNDLILCFLADAEIENKESIDVDKNKMLDDSRQLLMETSVNLGKVENILLQIKIETQTIHDWLDVVNVMPSDTDFTKLQDAYDRHDREMNSLLGHFKQFQENEETDYDQSPLGDNTSLTTQPTTLTAQPGSTKSSEQTKTTEGSTTPNPSIETKNKIVKNTKELLEKASIVTTNVNTAVNKIDNHVQFIQTMQDILEQSTDPKDISNIMNKLGRYIDDLKKQMDKFDLNGFQFLT